MLDSCNANRSQRNNKQCTHCTIHIANRMGLKVFWWKKKPKKQKRDQTKMIQISTRKSVILPICELDCMHVSWFTQNTEQPETRTKTTAKNYPCANSWISVDGCYISFVCRRNLINPISTLFEFQRGKRKRKGEIKKIIIE